jgi:hypothetical protein
MNYRQNRESLFDAYENKKKSLSKEDKLTRNKKPIIYDDWEWYFEDKDRAYKLYLHLQRIMGPLKQKDSGKIYDWSLFATNYACDKSWRVNSGFCKTNFASEGWPTCVDNVNGTKNSDGTLTYTSSSGYGKVTLSKNNTWTSDSGKNGKWSCTGSGKIFLEEKTTPSPAPSPAPRPAPRPAPGPSTGRYTSVNLTGQDIINGETVEKGMKGDIITKIQEHLNRHGASPVLVADGKYGDKTKKAVKDFQKSKGLSASGVVDDKTWLELIKDKSSTTTPPKPAKDPLEDIYGTGEDETPVDLFNY